MKILSREPQYAELEDWEWAYFNNSPHVRHMSVPAEATQKRFYIPGYRLRTLAAALMSESAQAFKLGFIIGANKVLEGEGLEPYDKEGR